MWVLGLAMTHDPISHFFFATGFQSAIAVVGDEISAARMVTAMALA